MLYILYIYSKSRKYWMILILSVIGLESISFCIQYFFQLKPCVLCIYQRCALYGIGIAGIIAAINPNTFLRSCSIFLWVCSSCTGMYLSQQHINMIFYPSPFVTCDLFVKFPTWLPLDKWWPIMFNADGGNCAIHQWYFLSFEISQWMLLIFIGYLIIALLMVISQFTYYYKTNM